jgi:hypothetical protein
LSVTYSLKRIKSTIQAGSVYYFHEPSFQSSKEHYFVVLNVNPSKDEILLLVCSRSGIRWVRELRKGCPETLVEITPIQYPKFTTNSIFDCNVILPRNITDIANMLSKGKLKIIEPLMGLRLVRKLRDGALLSNEVPEEFKLLLRI